MKPLDWSHGRHACSHSNHPVLSTTCRRGPGPAVCPRARSVSPDLEEVSVHYLQAAGGAQRLPPQGGRGRGGGRGQGGRRVAVVLENILRPRGTLSRATV